MLVSYGKKLDKLRTFIFFLAFLWGHNLPYSSDRGPHVRISGIQTKLTSICVRNGEILEGEKGSAQLFMKEIFPPGKGILQIVHYLYSE